MTVENYLQALADKDEPLMVSHICADYEFDALLELDDLAKVETELKDVRCQQVDTDGATALVTCSGSIASTYGSELFSYDLSVRMYRVIADGENWLVCGYTN